VAKKRGKGEGSIRQRPDGRWEARYTYRQGYKSESKSIYGKTQEEVRKKLQKVLADINYGAHIEDTKITVGAWLEIYLNDIKKLSIKQSTHNNYSGLYRHLKDAPISKIPLKSLRADDIQKFINDKSKTDLSARSIKHIHTFLRAALEQAVKQDLIVKNVAKMVTLPKIPKYERRILSVEEQASLVKVLDTEDMGFAILFCLMTGLRRGELFGLRWSDVDFKTGRISINQSLARLKCEDGKSRLIFGTPKTKSSVRTIPLLPELVIKLKAHQKRQIEKRFKLGDKWQQNDLVFCSEFGTPYDPNNLKRPLTRLTERAGITEYIGIHALRHTFATRALENGIPLKVVSEMLGHSSIAMTADIYSHVSFDLMENEIQKLSALM